MSINAESINLTGAEILIVDDQLPTIDLLRKALEPRGYRISLAPSGLLALDLAARRKPDLILLDILMPGIGGFEICRRLKQNEATQDIPVIFITSLDEEDSIIKGFRAGAVDYVNKSTAPEEVIMRVETHLKNARLMQALLQKNIELQREIARRQQVETALKTADGHLSIISQEQAERWGIPGVVAQSQSMAEVLKHIRKLQNNDTTRVLIIGESGTGKELIARAIHYGGQRRNRPFIAVNCAAIPSELAESLLFGHVRGAFTGAEQDKPGAFERADSGTLFLDEIGDMPLSLQVKLFRVLEDGTFTPVGGSRERAVDVRTLAATNVDLQEKIESGEFREELYYRIAGFPIVVPPLRERKEDIPLLADHLLSRLAAEMGIEKPALTHDAVATLVTYNFPGNVRELKNIIERAMIESRDGRIKPEHLHLTHKASTARPLSATAEAMEFLIQEMASGHVGYSEAMYHIQRQAVLQVLHACHSDRAEVARRLKIHRPNLNRLLKRLKIDSTAYGKSPDDIAVLND